MRCVWLAALCAGPLAAAAHSGWAYEDAQPHELFARSFDVAAEQAGIQNLRSTIKDKSAQLGLSEGKADKQLVSGKTCTMSCNAQKVSLEALPHGRLPHRPRQSGGSAAAWTFH